jgi:hypothetical protein
MSKGKPAEPMGVYRKKTGYSPLYQLYRRVERVAGELEGRRRRGWVPTTKYIEELYSISIELKILDSSSRKRPVI